MKNIFRRYRKFDMIPEKKQFQCNAPFVSLSLKVNGIASACCYMELQKPYDCYPQKKLIDIWRGDKFSYYRNCFSNDEIPVECTICKAEYESGNHETLKPGMYTNFTPHPYYPRVLEVTTDNICNLECIMCRSEYSSRIARKNEVVLNGQIDKSAFVSEIEEFIPHLNEIIISGGEPFLSPLSLQLMTMVLSVNPGCRISVNTNGTMITDSIKQMLEKGNFHINLSLDSIHKSTYEEIRAGANFDSVMENLKYFSEYAKRKKFTISIPVCPLKVNYKELPEIVDFCNDNSYNVVFVHVFKANDVALYAADSVLLKETLQLYESCLMPVGNSIQKNNAAQFQGLTNNVRSWLNFARKKEAFVEKLPLTHEHFFDANQKFEHRMKAYLATIENDDNVGSLYYKWKSKKDALLDILPEYFHNELFYNLLFSVKPWVILPDFEKFSIMDIKENLLVLGDNLISKLSEETQYNSC